MKIALIGYGKIQTSCCLSTQNSTKNDCATRISSCIFTHDFHVLSIDFRPRFEIKSEVCFFFHTIPGVFQISINKRGRL